MAYNKFIKKDGTVFLDLTADTVTEADVASGKTFHKADGTLAIGTASGGGGSSLPAGVYLKRNSMKTIGNAWQSWFVHNGELYALYSTTNGAGTSLYHYTGTAWESIQTTGISLSQLPYSSFVAIEYNGITHIIAIGAADHCTFDGTLFVTKNRISVSAGVGTFAVAVYDGKLLAYCYSTGIIYSWVEATDTWEEWCDFGRKSESTSMWVVNGELYFSEYKTLYKYENGSFVKKATLSGSYYPSQYGFWHNNKLYVGSLDICLMDFPNLTITQIGRLPSTGGDNPSIRTNVVPYNDTLLCMAGSKSGAYQNIYELFIVEDTATE